VPPAFQLFNNVEFSLLKYQVMQKSFKKVVLCWTYQNYQGQISSGLAAVFNTYSRCVPTDQSPKLLPAGHSSPGNGIFSGSQSNAEFMVALPQLVQR
jgi:hypothetical protein